MGVGGYRYAPAAFTWKQTLSIVQEAARGMETIWTGAENLAPVRFPTPDRPNPNHTQHRPRYIGRPNLWQCLKNYSTN